MKQLLRRLIFLLISGAILVVTVWIFLLFRVESPGPLTDARSVVIAPGSSSQEIAAKLEQEGVISSRLWFLLYLKSYFAHTSLKAGEYGFLPAQNTRSVIESLVSGEVVEHSVTIPEGLTTAQILSLIAAIPNMDGEVPQNAPEGVFLPETYHYLYGDKRADLLKRMERAQAELIEQLWQKRDPDLPIKTAEEAIILASIVEKETGLADERTRVSAVFINRLRKGMRLQSDPTVIYGLTKGSGVLDRPITLVDLQAPSPYNTYLINGLPPLPIANPGKAAIEAVLHPMDTDEIYFVADGTGGHRFAKTLEEHNRNVQYWRQFRRQNAQ
jgi:UPF0755 protein